MKLDNIYKNTITFTTNGNVEFNFRDNKSETRYLFDIVIDNSIAINNVFSIGTYENIGTLINNSIEPIGIKLDGIKVTLVLSGTHTVQIKIKQGILSNNPIVNNVLTPDSYFTIPVGYSFGVVNKIMTETERMNYINDLFEPFHTTSLSYINELMDTNGNESITLLYGEPYSHDNDTYPKFAYTDKLKREGLISGKDKDISDLISNYSIPNKLFIDKNIEKVKLSSNVQDSINLANTALQNIFINSKSVPETKINQSINLNLSDVIKVDRISNTNKYEYPVTTDGSTAMEYVTMGFQQKILNTNIGDEKSYFVSYLTDVEGGYGFIDTDLFFLKEKNIKYNESTKETDDLLYSSLKLKSLLFDKVDKLTDISPTISDQFVKFKINEQGQVIENELVNRNDLSELLDDHYEKTGVKRVINTSRSTIFYM